MGKECKYPLADARGSVALPDPKIVPKNKKFQRSTMVRNIRNPRASAQRAKRTLAIKRLSLRSLRTLRRSFVFPAYRAMITRQRGPFMKKFLLVLLLLVPGSNAPAPPVSNIEIVESIPAETSLDNPEIRNTREVWLEMIGRARTTLDLEQYYISDEPGKQLAGVLATIDSAAGRGVRVRILVDARMYSTYPASADALAKRPNIEVRRIDFGAIAGGVQHAKYFVVDGKEVFVGSQNFDWRALEHIHELGLRIHDTQIAAAYEDIFNLDWQLAALKPEAIKTFAVPKRTYQVPIRVEAGPGESAVLFPTFSPSHLVPDSTLWDERAIVEIIDGARKSLTLQFLSYSPDDRQGSRYAAIDDAIRRAPHRGVKVRMIVSDWQKGTTAVPALKDLAGTPGIEVAFTAIPEWSGGYIPFARVEHCKYIVADDTKFWLGTSNCEKNYFYRSRNLGIVCTSLNLAGALSKIFLKSWNSPYKQLITQTGQYTPREHGEKK
jgi:phosphatidylserine/phosphatidylglycerophosphate/cardiolipin synthase-like enzyme